MINNITEIRSDAYKVCTFYRRPVAQTKDTIGAWGEVVKALSMMAVLVNATMICFVGSQVDEYTTPDGQYFNPEDGLKERSGVGRLWIYCLAMEHSVLLIQFGSGAVVPLVPGWIEEARDTLEFKVQKMIAAVNKRRENQTHGLKRTESRDPARKWNGSDDEEATGEQVVGQDCRQMFKQVDRDGSGSLNTDEVRQLFVLLGMELEPQDVAAQVAKMDPNGDNMVTLEEFIEWYEANYTKNRFQLRSATDVYRELGMPADGERFHRQLSAKISCAQHML